MSAFDRRFLNYGALGTTIAREMTMAFNEDGFTSVFVICIYLILKRKFLIYGICIGIIDSIFCT